MRGRSRGLSALVGLLGLAIPFAAVLALQERPFPHEPHQGLFPVCAGCHAGVASGNAAAFHPEPELCARCHDGVQEPLVEWQAPTRTASNVVFDHVAHAEELEQAGDPPQTCEACHSDPAGTRMSVGPTERLDTCWSCHAHEADAHLESPSCETCHVPLAESGFERRRIETLPKPEDHAAELFLSEHHGLEAAASTDSCATCHTAERCVACHVDASRPEIEAMPSAPPDMDLPEATARYPTPPSHADEGWLEAHGDQAPVRTCNTCHTSDDCRSCHIEVVAELVEQLPARSDVRAPGVEITPRPPETHESMFFLQSHSVYAAADGPSCATCHTESYCVDCHDGPPGGSYHPQGFVSMHAADAFGRPQECASCHDTAAFCRACHEESGLGGVGRLGGGYHDAEPLWLLRHGQAARQSLESCASCHEQSQCVQCHGVLGAFKISPHGRDFDAPRAFSLNPRSCAACHVGNPLGGGA